MSRINIPAALRRIVTERSNGQCEYCLLHQDDAPFSHHVDHVTPLRHGGQTVESNLALACLECNRYKGSDLTPSIPLMAPLFRFSTRARKFGANTSLSMVYESLGKHLRAVLL